MSFFDNLKTRFQSGKGTTVVTETALVPSCTETVVRTQPDVVKTHIVVNPKNAFINYDLFSLCKDVPVAIESSEAAHNGIYTAIPLPTKEFLPYLAELKHAPDDVAGQTTNRTIYEIQLNNGEKMYIFPNLKHPKNPWMAFEPNVAFNVTPELNRAIIGVLKKFTR